jgi:hypothetical protein
MSLKVAVPLAATSVAVLLLAACFGDDDKNVSGPGRRAFPAR